MDASTLKGHAVVSLLEGVKLGTLAQPLFDLQLAHLVAFAMEGDDGTAFIRFGQVRHIGADAVTVASHLVVEGGAAGPLIELDQVLRLKVVDEAGRFVGAIAAVEIDPESGAVLRIATHRGGLLGVGGTTTTIEPAAILAIGPELLTLATAVDVAADS
jgi:sporulation protein YlmC with PRC-barrel domain